MFALLATIAVLCGFTTTTRAANIAVRIFAFLAPEDLANSPNFVANAIAGMEAGGRQAVGDPNTPDYWAPIFDGQTVHVKDFMVTPDFESWRGNANPPPAFDEQHGTRLRFGVVVSSAESFLTRQIELVVHDKYGFLRSGNLNTSWVGEGEMWGSEFPIISDFPYTNVIIIDSWSSGYIVDRNPALTPQETIDSALEMASASYENYFWNVDVTIGNVTESMRINVTPYPVPEPTLSILAGNPPVVAWPTNATGFFLQAVDNLSHVDGWITLSNTPTVVGTNFVVTNAAGHAQRFFRLKRGM